MCSLCVEADAIPVRREVTVSGRQRGHRHPLDQHFAALPVADEVLDRDHRQAVLVGELAQLGPTLHGAVVVDDLDQHAGRGQAREPREVDGRLGVPAADQHAPLAVAQREHVSRPGDLPGLGRRVGEHARGVGTVGRGDAGADAVTGVDRDGVGGPHLVAVVGGHQRDLEPVEHRGGHRHADHAAAVADREGHQLGRRLGRGEDEVALVLAVLVVDDDHGLAGGDVGDGPLDAVEADGVSS